MAPIEIVGAGLAGLSLGLALRRANVPVTIFEAGEFPRHRVCGEFIAGLDDATIDTLQLAPCFAGAIRHREVLWVPAEGRGQRHPLPAPAYGISRYELDARLARAYVAAGGDLRTGTRVTDVRPRAGRVFATGRRRAPAEWIGLKIHALGLLLAADLEVHLGDHAYVGLSRVENGRVNVCGLFRHGARRPDRGTRARQPAGARPGESADLAAGIAPPAAGAATPPGRRVAPVLCEQLHRAGLPRLAERLAAAPLDPRSFSAVAALGFARGPIRPQEIRIGDAGVMIPPFTGNGMAMAFQSAAAAVAPLLRYARGELDWDRVCATTQRTLESRFRTRLFAANALHPFLLRPRRQRGLAALDRAGLLPFRPLFAVLH